MAIPVGALASGAKAVLDAAKTTNESSAQSSLADVKPYEVESTKFEETEGDLGFDEEKKEEAKPQNADYTDQFKDVEMNDVADVDPTTNNVETTKSEGISGKLDNLFNLVGTASSSEPETSDSMPVNDTINVINSESPQGTDSRFEAGGTIGGAVGGSSEPELPAQPLNIPTTQTQQQPVEEEKSPLEQAKEAIEDGDIDDKELPFTDTEQAAEDVEDLVEDETKTDEEKEKELEKALKDDGKIDEGELAEEAGESKEKPEEESEEESEEEPEEDPKAKAKELLDKVLGYAKHDSSSSASSSIANTSAPEVEGLNIKSGGLGEAVSQLISGKIGESSNAPDSVSSNALQTPDPAIKNLESAVSQKGASKMDAPSIDSKQSNSATSSSSGAVRQAFDNIINGKGMDYKSNGGESKFVEALGGKVGSVGSGNSSGLGRINSSNPKQVESTYNLIRKQVANTYTDWKEKGNTFYKDKGSVAVITEDGKDIKVKMGTRRLVSLEQLAKQAPDKLKIVEEVIK